MSRPSDMVRYRRPTLVFVIVFALAAAAIGVAVDWSSEPSALQRRTAAVLRRAREVRERAKSFDPPAVLTRLAPNPVNGEYFRFDERHAAARAIDPIPPGSGIVDLSDGRPLPSFELDGDDAIPLALNQGSLRLAGGQLRMKIASKTQYLINQTPLDVHPSEVAIIELRLRVEKGSALELRWSQQTIPADWRWDSEKSEELRVGRLRLDTIPDGKFHTYRIDASSALRHRTSGDEPILSLMLQPSRVKGDEVAIDYLRFIPKSATYGTNRYGSTYEMLGDEQRAALFMRSPLELRYALRVPAVRPRLRFGAATLREEPAVRFAVRVSADGSEDSVYSRTVGGRQQWTDADIDLGAFAGREVEITLSVESERPNIAFWSNPILYGAPAERFNVIVLLEDALRADVTSVYGHSRPTTPNKERLVADRGVVFERAIAQGPTTRRSCPSLMTGLYASATGVWNHEQMLDARYLTLAEILRQQGFETASFTQNVNAGRAAGLHQGFGFLFESHAVGSHDLIWAGPVLRFLDQHGDRNFFVYLHTSDPHGPYDPPAPYDRWYRERAPGGTAAPVDRVRYDPTWVEEPTLEGRRLLYEGEVRHNDQRFAHLIDELRQRQLLDSTWIILLADHGEYLGEHGLYGHGMPTHVQVARVPLILLHPSLPAGRRIATPVQLIDAVPTILELAGIDSSALLLHGESLRPLWRDGDEDRLAVAEEPQAWRSRDQPEVSGSVFFRDRHMLASRESEAAIFDLRADPEEVLPDRGKAAQRLLDDTIEPFLGELKAINASLWRTVTGGEMSVIEQDPAAREQLRQLGYIE